MLELFGDKILMNGRHILTLPPGFEPADYSRLRELLERTERDPPELSDLTHWDCVLDPDGKLYVLPDEAMQIPVPKGWHRLYAIDFEDLK
jgi:hypothetical protein